MAQRFPDLKEVQSLFWRLLSAPEGVGKGAVQLRRTGVLESEDLEFLVRGDSRLGPVERLDIYADMYFYRLRDCLAEDFPKLAASVGEDPFHNLVTDYLLAHPSRHFSLREVGGALPGFLATHELARTSPGVVGLARLEWARVDVFDDADAAPLQLQDLVEAGTSAPEELGLTLVPSARLLSVDASVLPLWKRLDGGADPVADGEPEDATPQLGVCVWRKGFSVFHRSLPDDEERCLHALREPGTTLAQLGALLLEHQQPGAPAQQSAERLAVLLDLWARNELLTRSE